MSIEALTLAQWLSPSYPIGAFAYSHGLEEAILAGTIETPAHLQDWLIDVITHGSGRNDCVLLYAAYAGDIDRALINATGLAIAGSSERILETRAQGAAFCKTTASIWGSSTEDYIYPVAVGTAAAHMSFDPQLTASMFLHANIGNLVSASQRLMGLGQTHAQTIVAALTAICDATATNMLNSDLDDLQNSAFMSDIAAMRHETRQPRIFRT